jgi:hypothetical protein
VGFRFRRSFRIAPGIRLNLNSKSTSIRIGPKAFGYTVSSKGHRPTTTSKSATRAFRPLREASARGSVPGAEGPRRGRVWLWIFVVICVLVAIGHLYRGSNVDLPSGAEKPASTGSSTITESIAAPAPSMSASLATPSPAPQPSISAPLEIRFVTASSLNIRTAPETTADVMGKLETGVAVSVLRRDNGWLLIQPAPGREGWISERYTSPTKEEMVVAPPAQAFASDPIPAAAPVVAPRIDRDGIVQAIIERSIQNYAGNCPCPYNTMRNGRRCGGNSAYSKPGGRAPICYPSDVTEAMIAGFQ